MLAFQLIRLGLTASSWFLAMLHLSTMQQTNVHPKLDMSFIADKCFCCKGLSCLRPVVRVGGGAGVFDSISHSLPIHRLSSSCSDLSHVLTDFFCKHLLLAVCWIIWFRFCLHSQTALETNGVQIDKLKDINYKYVWHIECELWSLRAHLQPIDKWHSQCIALQATWFWPYLSIQAKEMT